MILRSAFLQRQKGVVLVLVALGMVVLLGVAALAVDLSHVYVSKTRLQNLVDSLALSAAISLNKQQSGVVPNSSPTVTETDIEAYAESYARTNTLPAFTGNNQEIASAIASNDLAFQFKFSQTLSSAEIDWKLSSGSIADAKFVRVEATNPMNIATWFARIMGFNDVAVAVSAVAGTTPTIPCDTVPMMVCGQTDNRNVDSPDGDGVDRDCTNDNDDNDYVENVTNPSHSRATNYDSTTNDIDADVTGVNANGNEDCYGYEKNVVYRMDLDNSSGMPGNFGLFDAGTGGASIKECLAGDPACTDNLCTLFASSPTGLTLSVTSEPGEKAGPIKFGLNSRFDKFGGQITYPEYKPDSIVLTPSSENARPVGSNLTNRTYDVDDNPIPKAEFNQGQTYPADSANNYNSAYKNIYKTSSDLTSGHSYIPGRRIVGVPFVSCQAQNGKAQFEVLGFGCFFLTHTIGNGQTTIYGELTGDQCNAVGIPSSTADFGFYKVQLYKDPLPSPSGSRDS